MSGIYREVSGIYGEGSGVLYEGNGQAYKVKGLVFIGKCLVCTGKICFLYKNGVFKYIRKKNFISAFPFYNFSLASKVKTESAECSLCLNPVDTFPVYIHFTDLKTGMFTEITQISQSAILVQKKKKKLLLFI